MRRVPSGGDPGDIKETVRHGRSRDRREQRHRCRDLAPARRARCLRRARRPAVEADITNRRQAEAAVRQAVERFGRLDTLVNNAGLMLLGAVVGTDPEEWERMIAVNVQGMLYTTHAALPQLLQAAEEGPRRVADIVNISSIAGRVAWKGYAVYNLTKFGVNGFTEALRQEVTQRHVRVGVLEPGGVATELGSHNDPQIREEMIDPFYKRTEVLAPEDIADGVAYMVTRPRHTAISELWIMPTDQA